MSLALLFLSAIAFAEDPEFSETEKEAAEAEKPEATASVEIGASATDGNAVAYTINGLVKGDYKWSANKLAAVAGVNVGRAIADADGDGQLSNAERNAGSVENGRRYFTEGRYDRFFGERNSLYVMGGAFVDPFAGYDLRSHEQLGYSRIVTDSETTKFVLEGGIDFAQENYVEGVDPNNANVLAARVMVGLTHQFNEHLAFTDSVEVYENVLDVEDLRLLNSAAVSAQAADKLSLKVSHNLTFDNQPVEGFRTLDHTTLVTVVATLL